MNQIDLAIEIIHKKQGIIRTNEAIKAGIHPRTLYALRDSGALECISRGIYRLATAEPLSNPDIVTVAARFPKSVVCLISALSFHDLTTAIPHKVYIALVKGAETPRIDYPPISVHRFSKESYAAGVQNLVIDNIKVKVYSPAKTIVDCFKFRNKIGMDVVLEALKRYKASREFDVNKVLKYAKVCKVSTVIKPYLETLL